MCTGLAGVPPGVKSPFVLRTKAPEPVACFTTTYEVYTLDQALALGLGPLGPMALLPDPTQPVPHTGRGTKAFLKPQTETKLPKFPGRDLDVYAEDFLRFLRSTGQEDLNERAKADLVINGCDNKDVKEVVSGALKKSDSWVRFLITLEKLYPTEAGSDPRGHLGVTWGVYLCAGKPPLADIILSHPPDLTRCDSVIGLAIPAMSGHIQYRGAASGDLYIRISGINRAFLS